MAGPRGGGARGSSPEGDGAREQEPGGGPEEAPASGEQEPGGGPAEALASEGPRRPSPVAPAVLASSCRGVLALALGASIRVCPCSATPRDGTQQQAESPHAGGLTVGYQGDAVRCLRFSPDGSVLASAGDDKLLCIWAVPGHAGDHSAGEPLACLRRIRMPKRVSALGFVGASWLLAADKYGHVHCLALPGPAQGSPGCSAPEPAPPCAQSPGECGQGRSEEGVEGRGEVEEVEGILGHCCSIITSMDVSLDGRLVATADRDWKIRVSRLSPGSKQGWISHDIQSFCLAHTAYVACVKFIGGGVKGRPIPGEAEEGSAPSWPLLLLSGGGDGKMCLWEPLSGRLCHTLALASHSDAEGSLAQADGPSAGAVLTFEALQQGDHVTVAVVQQRQATLLILSCNLKRRSLQICQEGRLSRKVVESWLCHRKGGACSAAPTAAAQRVGLRAPPTSLAFVPPTGAAQGVITSASGEASLELGPRLVVVSGGVPALPASDVAVTPAQAATSAAQAKSVAQAAQACFQMLVPGPSRDSAVATQMRAAEGAELGRADGVAAWGPAWGLSSVGWQPVLATSEGQGDLGHAMSSLGAPLLGAAQGEGAWEAAAGASREAGDAWHQELCKREYSVPEREFQKRKRNDRRGKAQA